MAMTDDTFEMASRRAAGPVAARARFDRRRGRVVVTLTSGLELAFRPEQAQGLQHATPAQLAEIEITPSGQGLHFPQLDADLFLPALLEGFFGSRQWSAAELGRRGGKRSSAAKAAAARSNGQRGGRPRRAAG